MTTFTRAWDAAYEALPTDANYMYEVDNYLRQIIQDVRERMEVDHIWKVGATDGEHKKITFSAQIAKPIAVANQGFLYTKDVSAKAELHWEDEDGNELAITSGGVLNKTLTLEATTCGIFYQDTAPTGWTIKNTLDDKVLFITKGSAAGGQTGGGAHSSGTWTHPNHTHTGPSHTHTGPSHTHTGPSHTHDIQDSATSHDSSQAYSGGGIAILSGRIVLTTAGSSTVYDPSSTTTAGGSGNTSAAGTGATGADGDGATSASATVNTWRPAAYCAIIAEKD